MSSLPSAVSEPSFPSSSLGLPTASPSPSLGLPSAAVPSSSTGSRVDNSAQRSLPPHLSYPQSKDVPSAASASLTMVQRWIAIFFCISLSLKRTFNATKLTLNSSLKEWLCWHKDTKRTRKWVLFSKWLSVQDYRLLNEGCSGEEASKQEDSFWFLILYPLYFFH